LKSSAQRSSRSRFIDPVATQSVPRAICTPMRSATVTGAVSPYSVMFERGDQMSAVPACAISAVVGRQEADAVDDRRLRGEQVVGQARRRHVVGSRRGAQELVAATWSMPSAMCGS
jgi:hypothetical protein